LIVVEVDELLVVPSEWVIAPFASAPPNILYFSCIDGEMLGAECV
jgi:hypothetical protein